ncbi:hypothetical protein ABZY42_10955 [Streptomyces sp. NPDC006622]|uniref:hypothetical protein n=1 Tax=Streptomyces sp. NPDC006622 TaxID=3155459 RepID=UPI00339E350A
MPFPPPVRTPRGPRRRTLLASAAGAALLAGCSAGEEDSGKKASGDSPSASVEGRARARAAADSAGLVKRYDAVLAVHPTLVARLAPLRAEVVRHLTAFGGAGGVATASPSAPAPESPAAAPSASAGASVSGAPPGAVPPAPSVVVPANAKDALADLAGAERTLADRRVTALAEVPGELARLLASVAAAGAAHAYLLTEEAR